MWDMTILLRDPFENWPVSENVTVLYIVYRVCSNAQGSAVYRKTEKFTWALELVIHRRETIRAVSICFLWFLSIKNCDDCSVLSVDFQLS